MSFVNKYIKGDKVVWLVVLLLAILSVLAVYSSIVTLAYKYQGGDTLYYLFKHGIILIVGFGLMILAHNLNYKYYSRIAQIAIFISIPLLLLTLLTGANINDASRWLVIPVINQTFQTSDLAKLALIMYLARILYKKQASLNDFKSVFMYLMLPVLLVCGFIFPANFSTAAMLFTTSMIIMFIGRVPIKYMLSLIGIILATLLLALTVASAKPDLLPRLGTWVSRIETFTQGGDSDSNFQADQAKIAIATGGIVGKGPGGSTQRNFLPHPYSDFIYAIVIEEYGLIGGLFVIVLYLILFYRGVKIAQRAEKTFGTFLAVGLSFSLVFQAMINMAVAVNLFPVTGQPLPLVSMGGTSIWFTCLAIGIILSVSRKSEPSNKNVNVAT
ncbi:MAG: FtsW/RodA/SpoVE family cell cycle protein [Vicingaceae bacterium]|nr:FtsW/RodA/SpoVE family cell cycle protein [Vicingaceae bacterium]